MKYTLLLLTLLLSQMLLAQNVQVDSNTYSPQELIEDILIDSNCIENVVVTNVIGGNFNGSDQSYGYFDASGTSFPFSRGIVLSTGRLANVEGPNTSLSDDDAPNWLGDTDLESILDEQNTLNATIIEFEFTAVADRISFKYLFASEEYQENEASTCQYSDLFGFLIRPISQTQYTNIALVPDTNTPVKVTTVHPEIPGSCSAQNETYFDTFNDATAPINFNGQTTVLTATADIIPNETYHVKLVIADEQNYRYDSAVFLEAGSFELSTDLGSNRLLATNNPLCENETLVLDATQPGVNPTYKWFKDGIELISEINPTLTVTEAGIYNVEVTLDNNCISYGNVTIEYASNPLVYSTSIIQCDPNNDGLTLYNLNETFVISNITNNDTSLNITNYFLSTIDAQQNNNPISSPSTFSNTWPNQVVFARVENQHGCFSIAEIQLETSNNLINFAPFEICDNFLNDGFAEFDLNAIKSQIQSLVPASASINLYSTINDIFNNTNLLNDIYQNSIAYSQSIFAEITTDNDCFSIIEIPLVVHDSPEISPNQRVIYCLNDFPTQILLESGVINIPLGSNYSYVWNTGETTPNISINQPGDYTVTVTNENNCSVSRTITVVPSNTATIIEVAIEEASTNNTVTVQVSGEGDYEFSLDHGPYQDSNYFENVSPGFRTVYVRDKNGCGIIEKVISVLGFPKFFTPNGDGIKDTWQLYGANAQFNSNAIVTIFDRYGKLIKTFTSNSLGWDGTIDGRLLPSNDYWFVVKLANGKEYRGHFALVR